MLAIGGLDSDLYRATLVLHVLAVVVGFGSAIAWTALTGRGAGSGPETARILARAGAQSSRILTAPFIGAAFLLGFALVAFSDDAWTMSDTWITIASIVGLVAIAAAVFVRRAQGEYARALDAGDTATASSARGRLSATQGVVHLSLVVLLVVMIWKPGA